MKKITDLISQFASIEKEITELEKLEAKASADLLLVASPNISVTEARTKILDARLTIDLTASKKSQAVPLRIKVGDDLKATVKAIVEKWNEAVMQAKKDVEERLITLNTEFFDGDGRAARDWWESGNLERMPVFEKYRTAFYPVEAMWTNHRWNETMMAEHFLRHLEKHAKICRLESFQLAKL
jgi:hypothetical protein